MANEFVVKNGLIVSGSTRVQGSVTATSFTGSFSGSIAFATSASYAVTASYALNAADSVWTGSAGFIYYNQGNVGIGTTAAFTIGGTAVNSIYAAGPSTYGLSNTDAVYLRRYGTGQYQFQTTANGGNTGDLSLQSYGGNVGIGTTSPAYILDVNGTSGFRSDMYVISTSTYWYNGSSYFQATNTSDVGILKMTNNSSPIALQPNGGSVGIGTTNPTGQLTVAKQYSSYTPGEFLLKLRGGNGAINDLIDAYYESDAGIFRVGYAGFNNSRVIINGGTGNGGPF